MLLKYNILIPPDENENTDSPSHAESLSDSVMADSLHNLLSAQL